MTSKVSDSKEADRLRNNSVTANNLYKGRRFVPAGTPLCLGEEREELARRLDAVARGDESLLIMEFTGLFESGLDFEYVVSFMLCANALAMWRTGRAVTRLLVLSGGAATPPPDRLYAFANQFRFLMHGGYARIDNARVWMQRLGVAPEFEPIDLRDFHRAVRVFSAARASPDEVRSLASADWYFGFPLGEGEPVAGHFAWRPLDGNTVQVESCRQVSDFGFEERFVSGRCEILSSPVRSLYKLSFDLTGVRAPLPGAAMARYLDVFSGLIGGGRDVE